MDYDWEENSGPGDVPEFGAIFMSNIAMKRECFKWKVFALPSSRANFVKQVKGGMVLFLFESEKRQLFGVYQATSDGAINIAPHAFNSPGKQFPAQVRFVPIWSCRPLFENEFRDAIRENYFSAKKFHFGLSKEQVCRLLQLFSRRKLNDELPPRQLTRVFTCPAGKDRRRVDHGSSARREGLEMEQYEDDFSPADMDEFFEYTPDRAIEADEDMLFIDRLENRKKKNTFGHNFLNDQAGDFMHKRKSLYENKPETELDDNRASLLSYGTDNQEVYLDKERIPAARCRSRTAENADNDRNIYTSLSPAIATKYRGGTIDSTRRVDYERPLFEGTNRHGINDDKFLISPAIATKYRSGTIDSTRRADYERPLFEGTNRHGINDDKFLMNDIEKNLDLHDSFRPLVSNVNEEDLERPGRVAGGCKVFMNSISGHKHNMNDDFDLVIPIENFDNLHRAKRSSGDSKLLVGERLASEHNLDNGLRLDVLSEKLQNPFDSDQRRFLDGDEVMKASYRDRILGANYRDRVLGSTTSYLPSGYDRSIPRQVDDDGLLSNKRVDIRHGIETFLRPVSTKYTAFSHLKQNSLDCFSKSSPDTQFSQLEGPHHFKTLNSTFHDSIVTRSVASAPELPIFHHGHSLPIGVDRGASLALDNPHYGSGGDSLDLSKSKPFDREGFGRYDYTSGFENENIYPTNHDLSYCHTAQIPQGMELICSAPANDRSSVFSPSTFGSVPLMDSSDLYSLKKSPLAPTNCSMLSQRMQKHIYWLENDERIAGNELLSSNPNLVDLDICHQEKHLTNDAVDCYKSYNSDIANEDSQHCLNPRGGYSDFDKQRRSVFTRLTSTQRVCTLEVKEKDADFYLDKSVDEVMDILNSTQNFQMKNLRKFKPVVRQHDREELPRTEKMISPEQAQPRFTTTKLEEEASQPFEEEGGDELPKETRAVAFKRRSELKKDLDENNTKSNVLSIQDSTSRDIRESTSRENAEPEGPVNKPQKRRKLVRPVFSSDVSVDGVGDN